MLIILEVFSRGTTQKRRELIKDSLIITEHNRNILKYCHTKMKALRGGAEGGAGIYTAMINKLALSRRLSLVV